MGLGWFITLKLTWKNLRWDCGWSSGDRRVKRLGEGGGYLQCFAKRKGAFVVGQMEAVTETHPRRCLEVLLTGSWLFMGRTVVEGLREKLLGGSRWLAHLGRELCGWRPPKSSMSKELSVGHLPHSSSVRSAPCVPTLQEPELTEGVAEEWRNQAGN